MQLSRSLSLLTVFLLSAVPELFAADFDLLPTQAPPFSASSLDFRYYLYTGTENNRIVNHGNLGLDFPVVAYEPWNLTTGIAAAVHLVMYPQNLRFPVDNFYATLAAYVDYVPSSVLSFRLYPIYHVSGHLADGTLDDSALANPEAVSAEMTKFETDLKPLNGLSLTLGYGRYYHVCSQKELTDHLDGGIQIQPWQTGILRPYLMVSGDLIHMDQWYPGIDLEIGTQIANIKNHAIGVALRYFNTMDPGYFFMSREKSLGIQFNFLL
jgi:hypothetical protein